MMKRLAAFMLLLAEIGGAYRRKRRCGAAPRMACREKVAEEAVAEYGIDRCFASSRSTTRSSRVCTANPSYKADCTVPRSSSATCGCCTAT